MGFLVGQIEAIIARRDFNFKHPKRIFRDVILFSKQFAGKAFRIVKA